MYDFDYTLEDYEKGWFEGIDTLKMFNIIDSELLYHISVLVHQLPFLFLHRPIEDLKVRLFSY